MIKQLFLFVNIISLFFYQLFFTSDVTVKQSAPETIAPNGSITVTITISKEDVTGFAKLQQTIPVGFAVESIESKGATFSFKDQILKYIWMSLPPENEFTISYKLKNVGKDSGRFTLDGRFSYLADNERKNIDIPTATFNVSEEAENLATNETDENEVQVVENNEDEEEKIVREIKVYRRVEKIDETKFKVELSFTKKHIDGFAKLTETIPNGFSATQDKVQGAVFSVEANEVKLLWLSVPIENEFTVSYFIQANATANNGENTITGVLSYLDEEDTKKINVPSTSFELNAIEDQTVKTNTIENTAEETTESETSNQEQSLQNKVDEEVVTLNKKEKEEVAKEEPTEPTKVTNTPSPETGIAYKVQVGAFRENISIAKFKKKFNLSEKIDLENHEGWSKLTTGSFNEYKAAQDKRNNVRNNVKTAFVTAYNKGNRITVQEALMISNQKWVN